MRIARLILLGCGAGLVALALLPNNEYAYLAAMVGGGMIGMATGLAGADSYHRRRR